MGILSLAATDEQLAMRAAQGDRRAFEELVSRYTPVLFGFCRRLMGDAAEAEDRTQEAFLKAYANIDRYQTGRRFRSWLLKIAQNGCIDALRARKAWAPLGAEEPERSEDTPFGKDEVEALDEAVNGLDGRARAVLHCKYALGMNATEIARELDMTPGNVRVCLHRAIKTLRTRLKP